jgi:SulP family sulfate permease
VGDHYAERERHPTAECHPGTMVLRINGPLLYFNIESLEERIAEHLAAPPAGLVRVLLDVSFSLRFDVSAGDMLRRLKKGLSGRGVALWLANAHYPARRDLTRQGLASLLVDGTARLSVSETLLRLEAPA